MNLFEKYSYKQKNLGLLIIFALLFVVSYKRSFKLTLETSAYLSELEITKKQAIMSQTDLLDLRKDIVQINKTIGKENVSIEQVQQSFLSFFENKSSNLVVNQIDEVFTFDHPDFKINTLKIDIRGNYIQLLRFIYHLENEFEEARLINSSFHIFTNGELNNKQLFCTLLLQNYARHEN
jgi:hypothetical protein